jgi:hypothetical protein
MRACRIHSTERQPTNQGRERIHELVSKYASQRKAPARHAPEPSLARHPRHEIPQRGDVGGLAFDRQLARPYQRRTSCGAIAKRRPMARISCSLQLPYDAFGQHRLNEDVRIEHEGLTLLRVLRAHRPKQGARGPSGNRPPAGLEDGLHGRDGLHLFGVAERSLKTERRAPVGQHQGDLAHFPACPIPTRSGARQRPWPPRYAMMFPHRSEDVGLP